MPQRKRKRATKPNAARPSAAAPPRSYFPVGLTLVLLLTVVVYWPALGGGKVWDDDAHITRPELQSLAGLSHIWFDLGATQQYYPLLHSAFWLEHKFWGDAVVGYHLVNVVWHALAVVLLYLILTRLKIPGALLAAAIFAVHPVMVESVAWMSEQKNTLSAVFYLSAMLVYLDFDQSRRRTSYLTALGLFVLGLATKTVVATLPAALLVVFWWQRGALSWKRDIRPLVPFFVLAAVAGTLTAWVERNLIGAEGADYELSLVARGLLAGRVVWFYLGKLLWPANLIFIYPRWHIDPAAAWQWMFPAATLGVLVALWAMRRWSRSPLTGWLLFVGTLVPVLGFFNVYPFKYSFVADHFQYLASLGIIVLAAAGAAQTLARMPHAARYMGTALGVLLVGTLAVLTWRQSHMYADLVTLYQTTVDQNPDCWMAHNNLGSQLAKLGNDQAAMEHYRTALHLKPNNAEAHNNLGLLLTNTGHHQQAIDELHAALDLDPNDPDTLSNMGLALTNIGQFSEGVQYIEHSLQLRPDCAEAHNNLGVALHRSGKIPQAIEQFRQAIELDPNYANAHSNLGFVLVLTGETEEAIAQCKQAVQLQPDSPEYHNHLGEVFRQSGRPDQAIEHYKAAVSRAPDDVAILNNLGLALTSMGRFPDAIVQLERCRQLQPNYAEAHNNLGVALAGSGKIPQAIEQLRQAVELNPDYANAQNNLGQVLVSAGDPQAAIAHFEQGLRLLPNSADVHNRLGEALRQTGQPERAVEHYQAALRLQPTYAPACANLAQALAVLNQSQEAVTTAEKAIELARSTEQEAVAEHMEEWLKHYRTELERTGDAQPGKGPQQP